MTLRADTHREMIYRMRNAECGTRNRGTAPRFAFQLAALLLLFITALRATAAEWQASTVANITTAAAQAQPGDTIVMRDGIWQDADILFTANGTAANPITLRPQTLGSVYLTGLSRLRLAGNYLVVDGLIFTNGFRTNGDVIAFQDTSAAPANNSRLTNCAIIDYNPPNPTNDTKWVSLYGLSNRVDNCYFKGKTNVGATLVVWVDARSNFPNYHTISRNYFGFRPALTAASNGGETIRVGTSEVSMNLSRTTVEYNYFEQCNGDVEVISSKSCENIYRHNTFVDCEGGLCLRHGNRCTVEGNYFFGHNKPLTGGVRIIGEDHKVFNNYFQDLAGTSSRAPLAIMQGLEDSPLNGYLQVYRATVAFNTFVNCANTIIVGLSGTFTSDGVTQTTSLPAVDCTIANNLVLQTSGKIVDVRLAPQNMAWTSNLFWSATLGITNDGVIKIDPQLVSNPVDGLWRPGPSSPALGRAGGDFTFVTNDFEGHARSAAKDIGADQASLTAPLSPPLGATNVGPLWQRVRGTFLYWAQPADISYGTTLSATQLNAVANAPGTFTYNPPAGTLLNVGTGQVLRVVFTPNDLVNFTAATQTVTINVLKAAPTVTWTNPAAITYGTALGATQLNATASVPGNMVYSPSAGTLLNASNGHVLSVTFTPSDTNHYATVTRTALINVTKATPVITWTNPAPIEQGTPLGATELNASVNAPGALTYSPIAGTVLVAGSGQPLSVSFVPSDPANYNTASRTVTINVTIGGKTVPKITWPAPAPMIFGTPLSGLQLNATADTAGVFAYSPPIGTVLPIGGGQTLSVLFTPGSRNFTAATKTVTIDVGVETSNAIVHIAYVVPTNRVAQGHAVPTLRNVTKMYQKFFADQMERNGFGRKTFTFETEPDGVTPRIHVVHVSATDAFLRGDIFGNRVVDAARGAGLTVGAFGQLWWLIAETHTEHPDGAVAGGFDVGQHVPASPIHSGWIISGGDDLALYQSFYQTNAVLYDGVIVPEIGPYPLVQDLSYPWFEGITLNGISSSVLGAGLQNLGEAFDLNYDFRNDENFNGNIMGFGFRGVRGTFYPALFPYNYCGLSYASALALNVNPFFNPGRLLTDLVPPNVTINTSGTLAPVNGLLNISFSASDNLSLHAAILTWQSGADLVVAAELALSGTNAAGSFAIPYFNSQQTNHYAVTVFDRQGNRRTAETTILPLSSPNHSPQPFIRVTPAIVGVGQDVFLDALDTFDPEFGSALLEVEWDLDGDGSFDTPPSTELFFIANYPTTGTRLVRARMTDPAGDIALSAPIAVSVIDCSTSLSPTNKTHGYGMSTGTVTVTSGPKCIWNVVNTNDWIVVLPNREDLGGGKSKLQYYTQPNSVFEGRAGTLLIGDQIFYVSQDPAACTFSLSPTNKFHGFGTGGATFKVSTKTNCAWSAVADAPWITITNGALGTNTGNVGYSLSENRVTGRRIGHIIVNDEVFTITQWGTNCEVAISPYFRAHSENSETGMVTVSTGSALGSVSCGWSAICTNSWIRIITDDGGSGSGSFGYEIDPNLEATPRTAILMVNDQPFTVVQGVCSYSLNISNRSCGYLGTNSSVTVNASSICEWSISNSNDWIVITSPLSGAGSNIITFFVGQNPRGVLRSGTFMIADQEFTVVQSARPCKPQIDPESGAFSDEGGTALIFVFADPGCPWMVEKDAADTWVTITDGWSGEGDGMVDFSVAPNDGPARVARLNVQGNEYIVSQASGVRLVKASDTVIGGDQIGTVNVTLYAHGGENNLGFSLCFDTNSLNFTSARLQFGSPAGSVLTVNSNQAAAGQVGFTVALPPGWSIAAGASTVVQVSFRARPIDGKRFTLISACDSPVPRSLIDALGRPHTTEFQNSVVEIIGFCSLGEALDAPDLRFTNSASGGALPWTCQTNVTVLDGDAAMSGATPDSGESYFETTVLGPGTLSFWWKVSSQSGSDFLRFSLGGSVQFQISGETGWEWRTFNVPTGTRVFRWGYRKSSSGVAGQDRAWVDQIAYEPAPPVITSQPGNQSVDQGGTATFSVVAAGQPPLTYQWLYKNVALSDGGGISGTRSNVLTVANAQPSQAGAYSVVVGSPQGNVTSTNALLGVTQILPLPEALDATSFTWTTSGNAAWVGQNATNHDGADAARSGVIGNSQSTSFGTSLQGPGTVSFWWKVSSESNDRLQFYVNGSSRASISGESNWTLRTFSINAGSNNLLWTYAKNSSSVGGQDRAWVDEFQFFPARVGIASQPTNQLVDQGATATMSVTVTGTPPVTYQWMFNGTNIDGATSASLVIPNLQPAQEGHYSVLVANAVGSAMSSNALLRVNRLVPIAEAVDVTNLGWTTNGSPPWVGQTGVSHDGVDAARSGAVGDSQTTTFQTTVMGPGTVSFWWKVSSDGSDRLSFRVNGSEVATLTGEVDWTLRSFSVGSSPTNQLLEWRYIKGSSGRAGLDAGWVDQIFYVPGNTPTAPIFAIQPTNRMVVAPATVTLTALALGSAPLSYQWFFNGSALTNGSGVTGATATNLTLTSAGAAQSGPYYAVATNAAGSVTSSVATLTFVAAPIITAQPMSQNVIAGSTVNFNVGVLGSAPLSYQWVFNGTNLVNGGKISGATTAILTLTNVQAAQEGFYSVIVSNAAGIAISSVSGVLVTWNAARTAPATNGESTVLASSVAGPGTLKFSWKVSSETNADVFAFLVGGIELAAISGEVDWRTETFLIPPGDHSLEWRYTKNASGAGGQDAGFLDSVEFIPDGAPIAPFINSEPSNQIVATGSTIVFDAGVSGSWPLSYQWRLNGAALANGNGVSGAKTPRLTLSGVQAGQAGTYALAVTNVAGGVTSGPVSLTVTSGPVVVTGAPVITVPPANQNVSENASASFNVMATGTSPLTYRWQFNGVDLVDGNGITGATTTTLNVSNAAPFRVGTYSVRVSNAVGTNIASASLTMLTLGEAVGAPYLTLSQAGDSSWIARSTNTAHDGVSAARSGITADGGNSRLETWVEGPGTVSFWWKVSSQSSGDNLRFYIGSTEMARISGEQPWQQQSFPVPSGTQVLLKWRYGKDTSGSSGEDAGWVDDVQYVFTGSSPTAPIFTNQPASQNVNAGTTVTFSAGASGSPAMSYQWRLEGTNLVNGNGVSGAKTPILTLVNVQPSQVGNYSLFVSNAAGTAQSALASLGVTVPLAAPVISLQPASQAVSEGVNVSFHAGANGAAPLYYQWQFNGVDLVDGLNVSGATSSTLALYQVQPDQIGNYSLIVTNDIGSASSANAALTLLSVNETVGAPYLDFIVTGNASWLLQNGQMYEVQSTNTGARLTVTVPPSISSHPASQTLVAGNSATFAVTAGGSEPLDFQWRFNGIPLEDGDGVSGANTSTLSVDNVQPTNGGSYSVIVSNGVGTVTSSNALLTVLLPPAITSHPVGQTVPEGAAVTFGVTASGTGPFSYRWRRNGTNLVNGGSISGVTSSALILSNAQPAQAGLYSVEVANAVGTTISSNAQLIVIAAMTAGEGANAPYLDWNSRLDLPWNVTTNISHDGEGSLQSGRIGNSDSTWVETTLTGPGTIRFWWKVSSQTNADILSFSVGGVAWAQISGEVDWQKVSFDLPAGTVAVRWNYVKDSSGTNGQDRAWLDEVDFIPTTGPSVPIIVRQPTGVSTELGTTVTLSVEALGTAPISYVWRFEGQELADGPDVLGSRSPTLTLFNLQVGQAGLYDVVVRNPYSIAISQQAFLDVIPQIALRTALDTDSTNLVWLTRGYSPWRGQNDVSADRIDSAQSGALAHNTNNYIETLVSGPGAITFWWKVSSETNRDRLRFLINGVEQANVSGEVNWRQRTFFVQYPGSELQWVYSKDASGSAGQDRAWVDMVSFGPSAPVITNTSASALLLDEGSTVRLNVDAMGTPPFSYQWRFNNAPMQNSDTNGPLFPGFISGAVGNHRLTISNAVPSQSGLYLCEVYNQAGSTLSEQMTVTIRPALPLAPALNPNLVWETEGASWWVGTTNVTHDGVMAARNGTLDDNRSSILRTRVVGPNTLKFWWRASTQTNVDFMTFTINGTEQARISGARNWEQKVYDLNGIGTTYVLEWEYSKDGLSTNGLDHVFVDEVEWAPIAPLITNQPPALTTMDAGSTITLTAGVRGTPPLTYQWFWNDTLLSDGGNISGAVSGTLRITGAQVNQSGRYKLAVLNAGGFAFSSEAVLNITPIFPLAEALDTTGISWSSSAPAWVGQGIVTHDGVDAARSPVIGDNTSSSMQATISGPGTVSFWWQVSSETNSDRLTFYTNNTAAANISGEVPWRLATFTLGPGSQTLKWTYAKGSSLARGQDKAWVDQFVFIPVPPSITSQPANQSVDQGGTATFNVTAGGTPPFLYQWYKDGVALANEGNISGATSATLIISNTQPSQAGVYSVNVRNAAGNTNSGNASLAVALVVPLDVALDTSSLVWTTTGSPAWIGQTAVSHDGEDSARIGNVANSGSASVQTTVTGPGTLSFWWKVSSETNNDRLTFYTNSTAAGNISGEVNWRLVTLNVGAGAQTLRWTYAKSSGTTAGQDRAWLDQVSFTALPPTITTQPTNRNVDVGGSANFIVIASGTPPFTYQWQFDGADLVNGGGYSGVTSSNLAISGAQLSHAGTYRVIINGLGGTAMSANARLSVFPVLTLAEALDTESAGLTWTTNGTPPWVGHGEVTHDGTDAARSGAIGASTTTSMSTTVNGPGTVSFWWKVSSRTNGHYLEFYTNNTLAVRISGEVPWEFKSVNLGSGTQTLRWSYTKNSSTIAGQDRAWVDEVKFGLVAPTITTQPLSVVADAGTNVTFRVVAAATPPISYQWLFNGAPLVNGSGIGGSTTPTLTISNVQAGRVGTYSVIVSNSVGTATSIGATLALSVNISIDQALDGGLDFTTGGTGQPWRGQQTETKDGQDAAQTGAVADSTYTWIKTTVTGPGPLSFWWRVSSELDHDYLRFMVDAVDWVRISGESGWVKYTTNIPSGTHELQWRYSRSPSGVDGQDRGWVDQVFFGTNPPPVIADPPAILIQPAGQTVDAGETIGMSVAAASSLPLNYQWYFEGTNALANGGDVAGATSSELMLQSVSEGQAGNYSVRVSNSGGTVFSTTARLSVSPFVDLAEAVDTLDLFVLTDGDAPWVGHTVVTHDGIDAARSGIIGHGERSTMETMLNGPGMLTFWWKVSSETNADTMTFSMNGTPTVIISGEVAWQKQTINLPPGPLVLDWNYVKNGSVSVGADRGWVDQLTFTPEGAPAPDTSAPATGLMAMRISVSGNTVRLTWQGDPTRIYKVYYKESLSDPEWKLLEAETLLTWQEVDGAIAPNVVTATVQDVLGGQTRIYRVLEY